MTKKDVQGSLTRVECIGANGRIYLKTKTGGTVPLLLRKVSESGLACGPQQPVHRVSVTYDAQPDDDFHTVGTVITLKLQ